MDNPKQYVIDYIEGRVSSKDFLTALWQDDSIFEWLQSIVPDDFPQKGDKYNVRETFDRLITQKGTNSFAKEYNIHWIISNLFIKAFPKEVIKIDKTLEKIVNFLLDACPEYIDGEEVEKSGVLERLLNELPEGLSKTQRVKLFREKIKAEFHVEGQKYPRWIQGGEWPYSNGKPMRFLGQKSKAKGEYYEYYFEDVDTHDRRTVVQFM